MAFPFGLRRRPAAATTESKVVLSEFAAVRSLLTSGDDAAAGHRRGRWDVARAVADGFERSVWVYKSVDTIAELSAALDFRLYDGEDEVDDHPLYDLLNDGHANDLETGRDFRYRLSTQLLLSPRGAFVQRTVSNGGTPLRFDLLPPGRTKPMPGRDAAGNTTLLDHYELRDTQGRVADRLDPGTVSWVRKPHPLDPYGAMTPLEAAGLSADLDHYARL